MINIELSQLPSHSIVQLQAKSRGAELQQGPHHFTIFTYLSLF